MSVVAFGSALLLFLRRLSLDHSAWPINSAHAIAAGVAGIVLFNSLLHVYLLRNADETINLMLLVVIRFDFSYLTVS
ncbi:MAG: hypothetical protein FJ403_18245 [Verrucomicrobia bacterium]|nr:hypothetical protein [Verrucomicrobiota bacterium]